MTKQEAATAIAAQVAIMTTAMAEAHRIAAEQDWDLHSTYDLPEFTDEEDPKGEINDALYSLAQWSSSNC